MRILSFKEYTNDIRYDISFISNNISENESNFLNKSGETNVEYAKRLFDKLLYNMNRYEILYHSIVISQFYSPSKGEYKSFGYAGKRGQHFYFKYRSEDKIREANDIEKSNMNSIKNYEMSIKIRIKRNEENSSDILKESTEFLINDGFIRSQRDIDATQYAIEEQFYEIKFTKQIL